jgi:DNA-binding NarL/FixJ family response regulator
VIRVLVVANSAMARAGLADVVRGDARLVLAGTATPGDLAARVRELDPDVVLAEADDRAPAVANRPSVLLVDEPERAWEQERVRRDEPPRSILARDASSGEIAGALIASAAGLIALQPRALARAAGLDGHSPLTLRERDVLERLARGSANRTIAEELHISEHTVKFHVASILAKLGAATRTEAVARGVQRGLVML